jgi:hypothetical protein
VFSQKPKLILSSGIWIRPIVLLNFEGFFDNLLQWIHVAAHEGFISANGASIITVIDKLDQLNDALTLTQSHSSPSVVTDQFDWSVLVPPQNFYPVAEDRTKQQKRQVDQNAGCSSEQHYLLTAQGIS